MSNRIPRRDAAVAAESPGALQGVVAKVPEITLLFWILKLITTGMGEAMSDFLGNQSVPIAAGIGVFGLVFAIWLQMHLSTYRAQVYWFAVMMVAIFGTMSADAIHDGASIPYSLTTPLFAAFVALVFVVWYRSEGTLSIHSITTRRRETFYWATVLGTFALGTAAGDLTATPLHLGFFASAVLFAGVITIPAIGWWRFGLNPIVGFWAAYIVTRPIGASLADWLSKPPAITGLGLGDGTVSGLAFIVFAVLVAYVSITKHDVQRGEHGHPPPERPPAAPPLLDATFE
jgi:uncharacterized membrane-anchored protein